MLLLCLHTAECYSNHADICVCVLWRACVRACACYCSALLVELNRGLLEQQYQQSIVQLDSECSSEKERAKDDLYEQLNRELRRQIHVKNAQLLAFHSYRT